MNIFLKRKYFLRKIIIETNTFFQKDNWNGFLKQVSTIKFGSGSGKTVPTGPGSGPPTLTIAGTISFGKLKTKFVPEMFPNSTSERNSCGLARKPAYMQN